MPTSKIQTTIIIIGLIFMVVTVGYGGYLFGQKQSNQIVVPSTSSPTLSAPTPTSVVKIDIRLTPSQDDSTYACPLNGWINCMPMLDDVGRRACSKEAIEWYKTYCANFKGVAM